ncbi:MAG: AAA family ATPase, partial [Propionibacteriaceae bacterium]|nr:AAA family ATPase [Propionibacteriaceae bacterium]
MERDAMGLLVEWRESSERKPLILRGARQVGKTWLLNNFGEANYANVAYFNFEQRGELRQIFAGDLVPERLLASLRAASAGPIEPGKTLIVFDEVQEAPRALTALKYFNEQANDY